MGQLGQQFLVNLREQPLAHFDHPAEVFGGRWFQWRVGPRYDLPPLLSVEILPAGSLDDKGKPVGEGRIQGL